MKDYHVEIKVKNNRLLKRIRDQGFKSIAKFARHYNLSLMNLYGFLTFRQTPIDSYGNWRKQFLLIADALKCMPEDICPPQHLTTALKKNVASFEANASDLTGYLPGSESAARPAIDALIDNENFVAIDKALKLLPPRYEQVVRRRFGLGDVSPSEETLTAIAKTFNVKCERIRQIERKGLRDLRNMILSGPASDLKLAAQDAGVLSRSGYWGMSPSPNRHYVPEWKRQELAQKNKKEVEDEA